MYGDPIFCPPHATSAAIDWCLLNAGPTAANLQQRVAAVGPCWDRQTDGYGTVSQTLLCILCRRCQQKNVNTQGMECYRIWSEPVPKLSSPHSDIRPASIRLPKNFQPVGVTKHSFCFAWATLTMWQLHVLDSLRLIFDVLRPMRKLHHTVK